MFKTNHLGPKTSIAAFQEQYLGASAISGTIPNCINIKRCPMANNTLGKDMKWV